MVFASGIKLIVANQRTSYQSRVTKSLSMSNQHTSHMSSDRRKQVKICLTGQSVAFNAAITGIQNYAPRSFQMENERRTVAANVRNGLFQTVKLYILEQTTYHFPFQLTNKIFLTGIL